MGDGDAIDDLLAGHALGDLDSVERQRLALLLRARPDLRQRLQEFQNTLELLPLALPAIAQPPQRLRRRLVEQRDVRELRRRISLPAPGHWLVLLVMGVVLLWLGLQLQQTRHQLARIEQTFVTGVGASAALSQGSRRMRLEPVDRGEAANGEVMVTGNTTHNVLMLNNLPLPPPHYVYRLWADVGGTQVGSVVFLPTLQGHVGMLIPTMPTSIATSVNVSMETDQLGTISTGRVILSSSL